MKSSALSSLYLLHRAMLAGQIIFIAIIFYLVYSNTIQPVFVEQGKALQVVALIVVFAGIFAGAKLFNSKVVQLRNGYETNTQKKLIKYRTASLMLWVLIEVPCLVCGICLFITGNYAFLALAGVIILYFAIQVPSKLKVAMHLGVNIDELDRL